MKLKPMLLIGVLGIFTTVMPALATEPYEGEVQKVNQAEGKITLKHGPIKKFDMEGGMTMIYRVANPSMLQGLRVRFEIHGCAFLRTRFPPMATRIIACETSMRCS